MRRHPTGSRGPADQDQGNTNTQFRLEFPVGTNGNGVLDRVTFEKTTLGLELSYLTE